MMKNTWRWPLESFFGLWAHDPEGNHWAGGSEYRYINRQEMMVGDPQGYNIIKEFLEKTGDTM